jgi:ATP-dependent RNA helicase RhlE
LLGHLVRSRDIKQALVFVRMKRDANRLARELVRDGINATAIHSDRSQAEREQALADFKENRATVLVATDIAARGLDIEQLPYVVNYELPHTPEDYVHRIGRTGRAGLPGEAISLVSADEAKYLAAIEKILNRSIPKLPLPSDFASESHRRSREGEAHPARETRKRSSERDEHSARDTRTHSTDRDEHAARDTRKRSGERDEHATRGTRIRSGERDEHAGRDSRKRSPEREEHQPRGGRHGERRTQSTVHRSKPSGPSDFDFTKPYVPAAPSASKAEPDVPLPHRGRPKRPTPALLGGSPGAHKTHK